MVRVRIAFIDLNGILVFNGGFAVAAPFEILIPALKVLLLPNIGIARTARHDHQQHENENG